MMMQIVALLGIVITNAGAPARCGEYLLYGQPAKNGVYLFSGTANEVFVRLDGFDIVGRRTRLLGQYAIKVQITRVFQRLPKEARFLQLVGTADSLRKVEQGISQVSNSSCE